VIISLANDAKIMAKYGVKYHNVDYGGSHLSDLRTYTLQLKISTLCHNVYVGLLGGKWVIKLLLFTILGLLAPFS